MTSPNLPTAPAVPHNEISAPVMALFGGVVAGLAGLGGGSAPVWHVALGALASWLVDVLVRRRWPRRGVLAQVGVLILVGATSAGLGRVTARPAPATAFERAFGVPPPAGVTGLTAKRRWYDGQITALRFRADATAVAAAVAGRPFRAGEPDMVMEARDEREWAEAWQRRWRVTFGLATLADGSFWNVPQMDYPRPYTYHHRGERTVLVWDKFTGEAYAVHSTGEESNDAAAASSTRP